MAKVKSVKTVQEQLRDVVNETTGTALTMSPNEEGWGGYLLQKKQKMQSDSCDNLCQAIIDEITKNRVKVEKKKKKKAPKKQFKFQ